ncbi:MAG: hypothetical protein LBJ11_06180, partial [Oscillospiraceae bacterium]|nr:hypothetical protein [Oscillospiraceae bacterium]
MSSPSPNYYCTWQLMEQMAEREKNRRSVRDFLNDRDLFGPDGMAVRMYPTIRDRLFFVVDDGWDLPSSHGKLDQEDRWLRPNLGSFLLSEEKFPGYGNTPVQRLRTLARKVEALGWRGLGVWVSPTVAYAPRVPDREADFASYWRTRLVWSREAGLCYWKIDWGDCDISDRHRRLLSELKEELCPDLLLEHAFVRRPVNRRRTEGFFCLAAHRNRLGYSDVLRTYDVLHPLSIPTTLSRVSALLTHTPAPAASAAGLINAEDEVTLCAALGLTMGIMRYDAGDFYGPQGDGLSDGPRAHFHASRNPYRQLAEAVRAVRWQETAPAFPVSLGTAAAAGENEDRWRFVPGETWLPFERKPFVAQAAPRIVARACPLPELRHAPDAPPYLLASRNPSGALSIAALGRVTPERGYFASPAQVRWAAGPLSGSVGIFGRFARLDLCFDRPLDGLRVTAVNLLNGARRDITPHVRLCGPVLSLPGELLARDGTEGQAPGDLSEPGLMLEIGGPADWVPCPVLPTVPRVVPFGRLSGAALALAAEIHTVHAANLRRRKRTVLDQTKSNKGETRMKLLLSCWKRAVACLTAALLCLGSAVADWISPPTCPPEAALPADHPILARDARTDNYAATDSLGRSLPNYEQVGKTRENRTVGLFYWTWHTPQPAGTTASPVVNVHKTVQEHPEAINDWNSPVWNANQSYFWNEPLFGYYDGDDKWVLRKHAEMLAVAGVDVIIFDNTNG